jgi:hypothetical protein
MQTAETSKAALGISGLRWLMMAAAAYLNEMMLALIARSAIGALVIGFAICGFGR